MDGTHIIEQSEKPKDVKDTSNQESEIINPDVVDNGNLNSTIPLTSYEEEVALKNIDNSLDQTVDITSAVVAQNLDDLTFEKLLQDKTGSIDQESLPSLASIDLSSFANLDHSSLLSIDKTNNYAKEHELSTIPERDSVSEESFVNEAETEENQEPVQEIAPVDNSQEPPVVEQPADSQIAEQSNPEEEQAAENFVVEETSKPDDHLFKIPQAPIVKQTEFEQVESDKETQDVEDKETDETLYESISPSLDDTVVLTDNKRVEDTIVEPYTNFAPPTQSTALDTKELRDIFQIPSVPEITFLAENEHFVTATTEREF